jgi:3-methyladenine DNA glycosylase AlkD
MPAKSKQELQRVEPFSPNTLREFVSTSLAAQANANNAKAMAAYMKTEQPFFGVNQPGRKPIFRELVLRYPPESNQQYRAAITSLWSIPQREGQYAAIHFADHFEDRHTLTNLTFFKKLIEQGAWWDHVDWIATHIVGRVVKQNRAEASEVMRKWIDDDDLWVRRTAIICQVQHKEETDYKMLFEFCLMRAHEKDFFIRKAIGWALRSYAWKEPERVRAFIIKHRAKLSGLSVREGGKHLDLPEK